MRRLISALAVAGIVALAFPAYPDENAPAVTAPNKPKPAGRAIQGDTVTAPNKPKPAGRAAQGDTVTAPNKPKPAGRAAQGDTVTAPNKAKPAGRAADKKVESSAKDQPGSTAQK